MASKSRRKKQLRKRKQKSKSKNKKQRNRRKQPSRSTPQATGSGTRHLRRLERQVPQAWEDEPREDVAVFDDSVWTSLPANEAGYVSAVREALVEACASRGDEALKRVADIPRRSPLSEWRLFLRGLVPWLAQETERASQAWSRLNPERRPGRIAAAMMIALRTDLDRLSVETTETTETTTESTTESTNDTESVTGRRDWLDRLDKSLLYHTKLLRRVRFDRAAIRIAKAGLRIPEESSRLRLGPAKIRWLQKFAAEYRATEPELVAALERTALRRAFAQDYVDMFDNAVKEFTGPKHDRRNRLLTFFYFSRFANDRSAERRAELSLQKYLTDDLPHNEELTEPLRKAIASQIHLNEAKGLIAPSGSGMLGFMFSPQEDTKAIRKHLRESVQACPTNRDAYKTHVKWIESKLDNDRLTKKERKPLLREMTQVMQTWSRERPDDAEPRLWLVDHLLENEELKQARPHVEWLSASRHDDPRIRATPWKWHLLEAMRLCRRKTWLRQVPEHLQQAEEQWPAWLSRQWLPYLKAAWTLRCGKTEEFEEQRRQICEETGVARDSVVDACMMLGAAQRMRVPSADLKPLRTPVDAAVKALARISREDLLDAGCFFWDLQRTQLVYPAYRMHGGKFAKEMLSRLWSHPKLILDRLDDPRIHSAVLLNSSYRFWGNAYEVKLPPWYSRTAVAQHPMFVAARVNAFIKLRYHWNGEDAGYDTYGSLLREAAQTEQDVFYRYWFRTLADELDDIRAQAGAMPFGFGFDVFSRFFGFDDDDADEDDEYLDEEGELGFDPDCDCPDCRAAKKEYEKARSADSAPTLF